MAVDARLEAQLRSLKRRQHAAVTWEQLLAAGCSPAQVRTRVERGEWQRRFRSVYILGDPSLIPLSIESAALLSFGPDAVLSHRTAAALWGLADAGCGPINISIPRSRVRRRPGVRAHLIHTLDATDVRLHDGLRTTSPARSVVEFATDASSSELEHACGEAVARRLMNEAHLTAALDRAPQNHPGAARIRQRLHIDPDLLLHTQSVAERIAYPLIMDAGLPRPHLNQLVEGLTVDLHWPAHKLIVEIDGFQYHSSRHAFERDRRRDQILTAAGYTVIRITWHQLTIQPYRVIAVIAQALAHAGPHAQAA